jgi:hypothetical protein
MIEIVFQVSIHILKAGRKFSSTSPREKKCVVFYVACMWPSSQKWTRKLCENDELQRPFESICLICHKIGRIIQLQNIPNKSKIIHIIYKNSKK